MCVCVCEKMCAHSGIQMISFSLPLIILSGQSVRAVLTGVTLSTRSRLCSVSKITRHTVNITVVKLVCTLHISTATPSVFFDYVIKVTVQKLHSIQAKEVD